MPPLWMVLVPVKVTVLLLFSLNRRLLVVELAAGALLIVTSVLLPLAQVSAV
jgi:hypothetical protein